MTNQQLYWSINEKHAGDSLGISTQNRLQRQKAGSFREDQLNRPKIRIDRPAEAESSKMSGRKEGRKQTNDNINCYHLSPAKTSSLSKSDQMLNRLLKDQLELAYIDHQKNLKNAQSHAALELLRKSEPRLEISPSTTRNSSPARNGTSNSYSRTHSPLSMKYSDGGWSSGSDYSYGSNHSASHIAQTPNNNRRLARAHQQFSTGSQTAPCSPVHKVRERCRQNGTPSRKEISPKETRVDILWNYIHEAVTSGQLENFDEQDPRKWWQKLFLMLKYKHGKEVVATEEGAGEQAISNAKASNIAGQLMGNPVVLEAIQNKLAGMVGGDSGYVKSLPKSVQRRIKALKRLEAEHAKIEAEFYKDIHELECKYASRYAPIYSKRKNIVTGAYEPTEEECDWPSSDEEDEESEETLEKTKPIKSIEDKPEEKATKGVESFWSTTIKNVDILSSMIQEHDEPILDSLADITVNLSSDPMGFTLEFHFDENEYFTDKVLTKTYRMNSAPDEEAPLSFDGPEIISCTGCDINWKTGKNVTISVMKKKQKNAKTGKERTITKTVQTDSFFNFFSPPDVPEGDIDEDTEALLQADYEIGHFIRERIVPHAVMYFTGDAIEDEDDEEDDEELEDDEDYDEDEDPDYDPSTDPKAAAANKECKQQ